MYISQIKEKDAVKLRLIEKLSLSLQIEAVKCIDNSEKWEEAEKKILIVIDIEMNRLNMFKKLFAHKYNKSVQRKKPEGDYSISKDRRKTGIPFMCIPER